MAIEMFKGSKKIKVDSDQIAIMRKNGFSIEPEVVGEDSDSDSEFKVLSDEEYGKLSEKGKIAYNKAKKEANL